MDVPTAALRHFALFRDAQDETLTRLAALTNRHVLVEGERLWRGGDLPSTAHFVVRGLVQVVKQLPNGDEASLGLFGPTECAGILAVLGPGHAYPADAIAASDEVEVLRTPAKALKEALATDAGVARSANSVLVSHAQLLRAKIDVLTAGEIPQRLATLFTHLADRFGDESDDGELIIPVTLTRRTLSRLVGARVETVIRVMTRWEREGFVETRPGGFGIKSAERLSRLVDGSEQG